jgi:hypothetical protein
MSDENPYGGTGQPPGNYPPPPPGGYTQPPQRSDRWKIWLGIGLSIPALILSGFLTGVSGFVDSSGALSAVVGGACLVAPVVMLFFGATRKVALGLLIGYAVILILFAGVCVALLASYN